MNSTFYIFGKFNGSYAQFPVDYTQDIFQQLPNRSSFSNTQLVIHRDGNLMYYCYMRKLEQDNFIGFCLLLNDAMIEEIPALFELFDNGISHLALAGEIVKINDNGDIVSNTNSLLSNRQTIQQIANNMMRDLNHLVETRKKLPAQSLAVSQDEIKRFNIRDDAKQIVDSALSYALVFVTKDEDSQNIDSYRSTIKRLKEENEKLQKSITTIKEEDKQKGVNYKEEDKKPQIITKGRYQTDKRIFAVAVWSFNILMLILLVLYLYKKEQIPAERTVKPSTVSYEVRSNTTTSVQNTYTPNSSVRTSSVPTNSTERIKQNSENRIVAESSDALYYLGEKYQTLYRFDKLDLSTQVFSYDNTMMYTDPHDVYFYDDLLVLIGNNNAIAGMNMDVALFFDTRNKRFINELYATTIERKDNMLITTYKELLVDNGYSAANEHFYWNEYYDLRGNLIDGKNIRGKGYIGKYPIEISMHCLEGEITGWYKYKGHTNYMTIKGRINEYNKFTFVEYNEKGERFGTFEGYANFQSQTLNGYFRKGNMELDFSTNDSETW